MTIGRVIRGAAVATGLLLALTAPAGAATGNDQVRAREPYPLKDAARFAVQGRPERAAARSGEDTRCRMPRISLSLAPHERAVEVREVSFDPRKCRATFARGVPPRSSERLAGGESRVDSAERAGAAGTGVQALATGYQYSGYAKAWYWDRRAGRVVNSVRSGADWNSTGSCIGTTNVWFRTFAHRGSGWFQVSRDWSFVNEACEHVVSSTDAHFRDRVFKGCSDGPRLDAYYTDVRFNGFPNGGQTASRTSRVEPSCPQRLTAYFALYRGQPPDGP
jgi:hypothetical protein